MIEIQSANLRDVSWIAANLRKCDQIEIACQVSKDAKPEQIAASSLASSTQAWTANYKGFPTVAFGFGEVSYGVLVGWAYGRDGTERCIPAITRFVFTQLVPQWLSSGVRRIEVRTIESHHSAHRWLEMAGARRVCALDAWGRNNERFYLYEWVCRDVPREIFERWQ